MHSNITSCAIPDWLPRDIVIKMVEEFSSRLKVELNNLQRVSGGRGRADTSNTGRMSMDSLRSLGVVQTKKDDGLLAFLDSDSE